MLKIAICDDETIFAKKVGSVVREYLRQQDISYEIDLFNSGKEFVALEARMMQYTIVFLDMNMDDMDGLETAKRIRELSDEMFVVFVTAYINYMQEGYKVDAIRYILKDKEQFKESLYECMDAILHKMNYVSVKRIFSFKEGDKEIPLNRLLYIESKLHTLDFHVMEDKMKIYTLCETLNSVEQKYDMHDFVRIHQSFLVNMKHVKNVKGYEVLLNNGEKLTVSKVRYKEIKDAFIAYRGDF